MTIRHSISWWCFESLMPPEKLISTAVALGFDGIELVGQQHWDAIRDAGLEIAAVVGHESLGDGLNKVANHDRIEREIIENLKLAEEYSIRRLICFTGNRHGESDERGLEVTAEGLRRVAKAAEEADVYLVLELLNSKVNHAGYQCDCTEWGVEVIKRVASPRVGLLYDIYHMQIMEGDLIRTIQNNHDRFAHYHTAGNPGRNNLDETQEIYYPAVIAAIRDTGYDGYLGHEFIPVGNPVEALKNALEVCTI
ncbi:MAG: TIM barrel protein [Candidatus Poribacteria bacterium]|nr:TIM barrel protein [Candidatus Poribacteria bacterium]